MTRNIFFKSISASVVGFFFAHKAKSSSPAVKNGADGRYAQDIDVIECDGTQVPVVAMRCTMAEVKPSKGKGGSLWVTRKPTGLLAYDRQGNVYWQENPGDPWENLSKQVTA